jgi:hypothetical protein
MISKLIELGDGNSEPADRESELANGGIEYIIASQKIENICRQVYITRLKR